MKNNLLAIETGATLAQVARQEDIAGYMLFSAGIVLAICGGVWVHRWIKRERWLRWLAQCRQTAREARATEVLYLDEAEALYADIERN